MPRSAPLDALDVGLLNLLQRDAGRTLRELGDDVGLSPSAVQRRIARYEAAGLIARRVAVLDPRAAGGTLLAVVLVTLERESAADHGELRARLRAAAEVQQCYDVAGEYDYVVVVATTGMPACRELVDRLLLGGPPLKRLVTLPVFDAVKRGLEVPVRRGS